MVKVTKIIGVLSAVAPCVHTWGVVGHQAVGFIAMQFLKPRTLSFVKSSLGANYSFSLGPAATWADEIKSDPSYAWASDLHFVDAEDNPPSSCSLSERRDCPTGRCILGALSNYTSRVVDNRLSKMQRQEALKFLDHFIGDIGQPLHVEARALGGNQISVICNGSASNLHSVWDTGLITRLVNTHYGGSSQVWANALAARVKGCQCFGVYTLLAHSWISCSQHGARRLSMEDDISQFLKHRGKKELQCPLVWGEDANKFDCSYVFNFSNGTDLCNSKYFNGAVPIIEAQVAKQGYRLAAWLNALFDD